MKKLFLIPLLTLMCSVMAFAVDITSRAELQSFLETAGTNSGVIAADLDLTAEGVHFVVAGTKDLTINEGVTLSLKSAWEDKAEEQLSDGQHSDGFCFYIAGDAKLTVKGNGTIAADRSVFFVENGGELVIGEESKASQLNVTTSEGRVKNRIVVVNYDGKATVYNGNFVGRSGVFLTFSLLKIDGGTYLGKSSDTDKTASKSGLVDPLSGQYTYAINCQGTTILKNATVKGVHGCVCPAANGRLEIDNCTIISSPTFADYSGAASFRPLYGTTYGIATVRNSKLYSESYQSIYISNNDTQTTYALIFLYENCYFGAGTRANAWPKVAGMCKTCDDILFPVEVDKSSEWYTIAKQGGGTIPLPNGYTYQEINGSTGETIDGYKYYVKTVGPATETQEADNSSEATIPWQQQTTWDADWTEGDAEVVPETTTAVTIPEGKVVVVSNDPAYADAEGNIVAEASQVNLAGEGASLTVQDGATLNVTSSMHISAGAKLVVDAGAVVTVGAGGVIATDREGIEVKTQEGKTGTFMIAPTVTENTHPMAKVELVSKAYKRGENDYVWQRFGVPAYMQGVTRGSLEYDHVAAPTSVLKLDYANNTWASMDADDEFIPFQCYELTTTAATPGAVYTFTCPLMGNGNATLELSGHWNYYANSYTAPIDIQSLIESYKDDYPHLSATVYLYRAYDNWWYELNEAAYVFGVDENNQPLPEKIDPMQAFIFELRAAGDDPQVSFLNNVWNPIMNPGGGAGAPKRNREVYNKAMIEIEAADGTKDAIRLVENDKFSAEFDNSFDAAKYMNDNSFNLFADANGEQLGTIATNDLEGTTLSMTTKGQTSFTMTISNVSGMNYAVRDVLTGTEIAMEEGATYMFTVPENANVEGRFEIVDRANVVTSIDNTADKTNKKGIYTMTGQFVGNDYHNLPAGVYVVDGKKIVK